MTYTHKMTALPSAYDTAAIEKKWQTHWREKKTYAWDASVARENSYVIDTPPPTVSGLLHMGHVFSYTQADIVARFQRMTGKNVFYPMGFDDNGLPTERLVEKTKKIRAADMPREKFIEECLSVSEEARAEFRALFESIALSVDWDQEYHTISDASRRLSQLSFLDLVKNGHVYRKLQPMLWDPVDQTAIAQAEIVDKELPSFSNTILFTVTPSNDGAHLNGKKMDPGMRRDEVLEVMTTRPELLAACVALFFHPDDARYQSLKGKHATVPLFGFHVPILEDDTVEPEKGTGLMMCCTFGDEADIQKWQKHNLPTRVILNKYAKLDFTGLDVEIPAELAEKLKNKKTSNTDPKNPGAREIIAAELEAAGLLKEKKPITHAVKCAERSGAPLELIPSYQWFVKVTDKKDALKEKAAECNWNPEWMKVRMDQWIDGLNWDWCISRQRYFGVPFPVWYAYPGEFVSKDHVYAEGELASRNDDESVIYNRNAGEIIYAKELPTNPISDFPEHRFPSAKYDRKGGTNGLWKVSNKSDHNEFYWLEADMDVMDTWATSSISPQLSAHGITAEAGEDKSRFNALFPADLRPQAHEIIRTWAFYTLVKSYLHNHSVPWHNLMISGWCLAEDKTKMSKSKGNVVTPVDLINEKGTDAVRYWTATSRLGQDTAFSPDLLKIGRKLVNKLWNATQFAAIHLEKMTDAPQTAASDSTITETLDQWILSRLSETVTKATTAFTTYEYAEALDATNQFFWADFCDNYLELIKKRVYNEDGSFSAASQQSAVRALYYCLNTLLKLYAPFMPHVTEELFSHIFAEEYASKGSLHARGTWPKPADFMADQDALEQGSNALKLLDAIRTAKSNANVSIKFPVKSLTIPESFGTIDGWIADVASAGNVQLHKRGGSEVEITLADAADAA